MKIHPNSLEKVPNGIKEFPSSLMSEINAIRYHSQSLARLNERGGMSYIEIISNIFTLGYRYVCANKDESKHEALLSHILKCTGA